MLFNPAHSFKEMSAADLIEQSFQYVGILPAQIDDQMRNTALYALNEIQTQWCNDYTIQFNLIHSIIKLQPNVPSYRLPSPVYKTLDCQRVLVNRLTAGVPFSSSGGVAANAFDNSFATSCTQTTPNGSIGIRSGVINPGTPIVINYIGVLSNVTRNYQLAFEASLDGIEWIPIQSMKRVEEFSGIKNDISIKWFPMLAPLSLPYWRIREFGGATLDICEIYFETLQSSFYIKPLSQDSYDALAQKPTTGYPTTYAVLKENDNVVVYMWGIPTESMLNPTMMMDFRTLQYPVDINYIHYPININQKFLKPLRANLTYELSIIFKPELSQALKMDFLESFNKALNTDADVGDINIMLPPFNWDN